MNTPGKNILIVGGSGFVSGTLAREAVGRGFGVWIVTRGKRPVPEDVRSIVADRKNAGAFAAAVAATGMAFDLVVDCIAYEPADVKQDIAVFAGRAKQIVLISTDFVYLPTARRFPQPEADAAYVEENNYGGNKRRCELELINGDTGSMAWTILRPCHIFGPGSQLGCSPPENRDAKLIEKLRAGQTLALVGAHLLQQPIFAPDLAGLILSVAGSPRAAGQVFNAAGPDVIESRTYYQIIADVLGVPLRTEEVALDAYLAAHPDKAPFLCHRFYDLTRLHAAGLAVPSTPVAEALRAHVRALCPA
ncbi:MAG: NAD-dependent epimerase/dehydratase family protein [Planctomycetes bacterium]|nr:NAD-dependent epimerase/dehydratase family protein [Planctomycetota bacterium]